ncbi:Penicillin-binding protein 1B [Sinobacterium norvegicum]|uniref:Penicillin-binding protein 1B n=1 Tax=Sinobacterium norvegicum TaxID=1641715 RepID=A0ABN8EMC2_9GAMM|nr:penicillin-binding protein 1B [Sinobacterium norvegicum]CAH0992813.1 Penicillin-binding protein 1B [Sinobacterium norvegicum]
MPAARKPPAKKRPAKKTAAKKRKPASKKAKGGGFKVFVFKLTLVLAVVGFAFIIFLDAQIRSTFSGKKWEIPAKVYARPLELYQGKGISQQQVITELRNAGYRPVSKVSRPGHMAASGQRLDIYSREFSFWDGVEPAQRLSLQWHNGKLERLSADYRDADLIRLEPLQIGGIYPSHNEDRLLLKLDQIPLSLQQMLVEVEDGDFYQHWGISVKAIARASVANIKAGRVVQGGSTLTQQLVKNYYLHSGRSFYRKATEAVMSLLLELHYSKEEILQGYFNEVFLAQDGPRAIHGFGLAAQYYFNKPIENLRLPEQALLVALVRGPSYYDPWRHGERAKKRRNLVLDKYAEAGYIDGEVLAWAKREPIGVATGKEKHRLRYPAYLDLVREQLRRDYHPDDLSSKGLNIFTSFDPQVQTAAEQALAEQIVSISKRYKLDKMSADQLNGGVVVSHPQTGEVLAVVGGKNARYAGFNRAINAKRPVGSLMKPAVYLAALEQQDDYNLITPVLDEPITVEGRDGSIWQPRNYSKKSHGPVPLHQALTHSYNQATAQLGMELGIGEVLDAAKRLGVESALPRVPSVVLGSGELSPIEVTQMYQTISSGGFYSPLKTIRNVTSNSGEPLNRYPLELEQRFDERVMQLMQYNLQEVMREGTGKSAYRTLGKDFKVAGKTGTTNDLRDSWFAGFSGDRLAVVWLGRDDNAPTPLTGATGALPVWTAIIDQTSSRDIHYQKLEGMSYLWVDESSGRLSAKYCDGARYLPFIESSEPEGSSGCGRATQIKNWFGNWLN